MDNQPSTPINNLPPTPSNNLPSTPPPTPQSLSPAAPAAPVPSAPPVATVAQPIATKKKSHKGLIVGIVCLLLVLIGGGVAAAVIISKTQPINMITSAFANLLNAEYVAVDGQVNISSIPALGDNHADITFNTVQSGSDYSTVVTIKVSLPAFGVAAPLTLEVSDVVMSDGVLYFKVKGIQDILTPDNINLLFVSIDDATSEAVISAIQNIGAMLEDKWIKVSYSEILSSMVQDADQQIAQMDCVRDIYNNISKYSGELSSNYSDSPFLIMTPQNDSFYDISFDTTKLAGFINSLPRTQLVGDIADCYGVSVNTSSQIPASNLDYFNKYIPNISVKFDGFMDYRLSRVKISTKQDNNSYVSVNADLGFSYAGNTTITAPADATSVVDIIQMIISSMYSSYSVNGSVYDNCSPDTNCVAEAYKESDYYISEN